MWNTFSVCLSRSAEIATVQLRSVLHALLHEAKREPPRSSTSASQWGLCCRARVYRHQEKHVDSHRRKILLFKNKPKKYLFELGIGFLDISCHYLSLGNISPRRKFPAYTGIWTNNLPKSLPKKFWRYRLRYWWLDKSMHLNAITFLEWWLASSIELFWDRSL